MLHNHIALTPPLNLIALNPHFDYSGRAQTSQFTCDIHSRGHLSLALICTGHCWRTQTPSPIHVRVCVCVCVVSYHTPQLSAVHENCHHTADHRGGSTRTNRNLADRPAALWNLSENLFAGFWGILWAFFLLRSPPSQPFYLVIPHADTTKIGRVKWSNCGEVLDCKFAENVQIIAFREVNT